LSTVFLPCEFFLFFLFLSTLKFFLSILNFFFFVNTQVASEKMASKAVLVSLYLVTSCNQYALFHLFSTFMLENFFIVLFLLNFYFLYNISKSMIFLRLKKSLVSVPCLLFRHFLSIFPYKETGAISW
jgi:hypothetical protein